MNRVFRPARWLAASLMAAALVLTGCEKPRTSTPVARPRPSPEESFNVIMETFRRRIEDVPSGFVASEASGRSVMMASNKVSSEVIPPAKGGEPYRATVTVTSKIRYSLQRSTEEGTSDSKQPEEQPSGIPVAEEPGGVTGVEILEPGLVASPSSSVGKTNHISPGAGDGVVRRRNDEDKRTFNLLYDNGRWTLVSKTDPDTERSIQFAFDEALGTQI